MAEQQGFRHGSANLPDTCDGDRGAGEVRMADFDYTIGDLVATGALDPHHLFAGHGFNNFNTEPSVKAY